MSSEASPCLRPDATRLAFLHQLIDTIYILMSWATAHNLAMVGTATWLWWIHVVHAQPFCIHARKQSNSSALARPYICTWGSCQTYMQYATYVQLPNANTEASALQALASQHQRPVWLALHDP